jgi:hypothetical protein
VQNAKCKFKNANCKLENGFLIIGNSNFEPGTPGTPGQPGKQIVIVI